MTEKTLPFRVAIPARYASTRLPGKPLRLLAGRPLLEHVYRRAVASGALEVVIATDDSRIRAVAEGFGATVCMTAPEHPSGTDRLAETAAQCGWPDDAIVVNVQGDEPGLPPALVRQVAAEYQLNPITVSRAYQELADDQLVEKRRGLGMYVTEGATTRLKTSERDRFLTEEWPLVLERIQRLGLDLQELLDPKGKWGPK